MKTIGRILLIGLISVLATGCNLYRTSEGIGIIGPSGGFFWCDNNSDCDGTRPTLTHDIIGG